MGRRRPDASCTIRGVGPLAAERKRAGLRRLLVWHRPEQLRALPPLMRVGLRAVGSACYQVFSHFAVSFGGNLLAMLLSLPIVLVLIVVAFFVHSLSVVPLGIAVLVGALPNPACMGLQSLAREIARGDSLNFGEQWQGVRTYWRVGL